MINAFRSPHTASKHRSGDLAWVRGETYLAAAMADEGSSTWPLIKGGLLAVGGLAAVLMVLMLLKPLLLFGVLVGAGYVSYRLFSAGESKAIEGKEQKALAPGSTADFDRRMRELDAEEKRLDAEIRKG